MIKLPGLVTATAITLSGIGLASLPAQAAERILIPAGPLTVSLPVSEIEAYVRNGQTGTEFAQMISSLPPERAQQLKRVMGTRLPFGEGSIKTMLRSPMGGSLLGELADVMKPPTTSSVSATEAWRKALLRAADNGNGGFTLLDVVRAYPKEEVVFDVDAAQTKVEKFQAMRSRFGGLIPGLGGGNNGGNTDGNNNNSTVTPNNNNTPNNNAPVTPNNNNSNDNNNTNTNSNNGGGNGLNGLGNINNLSSLFSLASEMQGLLQIFRPQSGVGGSLSNILPGSMVNRRPDIPQIIDSLMNIRQVIGR
jgi:Alpha/beta hydrolase of unknown function (DUF1400)